MQRILITIVLLLLVGSASIAAVNLSQRCPYRMTATLPDAARAAEESTKYPDKGKTELTDGVFSTNLSGNQYTNPAWVGLLGQDQRVATIDLQSLSRIQSVTLSACQLTSVSIYFPEPSPHHSQRR